MSTAELRKKVFEKLESAEDHLLEEILGLIELESASEEIITIPDHFKESLEKSIAQKKAGITIPNKEVEQSIEKWLYK